MEYEIEEEGELLDESNNPSLDHSSRHAARSPAPVKPQDDPAKDRTLQKAVLIPEESAKA